MDSGSSREGVPLRIQLKHGFGSSVALAGMPAQNMASGPVSTLPDLEQLVVIDAWEVKVDLRDDRLIAGSLCDVTTAESSLLTHRD